MSKNWTKLLALVAVFCMLFSVETFAGKGTDQSSGGKKKTCFFTKVGKALKKATQKIAKAAKNAAKKTGQAIKTVAKKTGDAIKTAAKKTGKAIKTAVVNTGKAIKVTGAKINNAVKDSGVWAKYKLLGCKHRVWVVGHYDKNGKWVKGHWRKLDPKGNNTPDQGGNNPNQGNNEPGQTEEPLPPVDNGDGQASGGDNSQPTPAPADPVLPEFPEGDAAGNASGSADADPAAPAPAPADPVVPEVPGDEQPGNTDDSAGSDEAGQAPEGTPAQEPGQSEGSDDAGQAGQGSQAGDSEESGQTSQQSGDAAQGAQKSEDEQLSLRTMGMLMNDLVKQSGDITNFKRSATPGMNFSMDVQTNVNANYEVREKNARLLVKVIVWDLQKNDGAPGEYFKFFTHKMKTLNAESRKLIKDVLHRVKDGVMHGSGHMTSKEQKEVYQKRLGEIEGL